MGEDASSPASFEGLPMSDLWSPEQEEEDVHQLETIDSDFADSVPDAANPDEPKPQKNFDLMAEVNDTIARVNRHMKIHTTNAGLDIEGVEYSVFNDTRRKLDLIQEISNDGLHRGPKRWTMKWDIPEELLFHFKTQLEYDPLDAHEEDHKRFEKSDDPLARACQIKYKRKFF